MRTRLKSSIAGGAILTLFSLGAVGTAEWVVRSYFDERPVSHNKEFIQYDPLLGWVDIPNKVGRHIQEEYRITESFNSKGIRGPEYTYEKPADEFRILILGDSFAEGYVVEFEDLVSEVLNKELDKIIKARFEVINLGTAGYSTDQELLMFRNEGKKFQPDLTILFSYYNDTMHNTKPTFWRGGKPYFVFKDGQLTLKNVPVPKPEIASADINERKNEENKGKFRLVKDWLKKNSALGFLLAKNTNINEFLDSFTGQVHAAESRIKNQAEDDIESEEANTRDVPEQKRVWNKSYDDEVDYAWKLTEQLIKEIRNEAVSVNSDFLIFYVPFRAEIYPEEWEATKRKYGWSDEDWDMAQVPNTLREIATRNEITFIDPRPIFRSEAAKSSEAAERLYFVRDFHWTPKGHALAGRILAKHVIETYAGH